MDVCTIIAKNYVAQARVLARSFAAQHPDAEIRALTERGFAVEALSLAGLRDVERRLRELVELEVAAQSGRIDDAARDDSSVS